MFFPQPCLLCLSVDDPHFLNPIFRLLVPRIAHHGRVHAVFVSLRDSLELAVDYWWFSWRSMSCFASMHDRIRAGRSEPLSFSLAVTCTCPRSCESMSSARIAPPCFTRLGFRLRLPSRDSQDVTKRIRPRTCHFNGFFTSCWSCSASPLCQRRAARACPQLVRWFAAGSCFIPVIFWHLLHHSEACVWPLTNLLSATF